MCLILPFGRFIRTGTESGEISDAPNNADGEADDSFDFTAPVRSFLEKSRKQVQHYFSGTQDPVESSYAERNAKKKDKEEGIRIICCVHCVLCIRKVWYWLVFNSLDCNAKC